MEMNSRVAAVNAHIRSLFGVLFLKVWLQKRCTSWIQWSPIQRVSSAPQSMRSANRLLSETTQSNEGGLSEDQKPLLLEMPAKQTVGPAGRWLKRWTEQEAGNKGYLTEKTQSHILDLTMLQRIKGTRLEDSKEDSQFEACCREIAWANNFWIWWNAWRLSDGLTRWWDWHDIVNRKHLRLIRQTCAWLIYKDVGEKKDLMVRACILRPFLLPLGLLRAPATSPWTVSNSQVYNVSVNHL